MNRYKLELDKLTVPERTMEDFIERANRQPIKLLRHGMVLAACLAVLCALSVAAVARAYSGWYVGEVTRFDTEEYLAAHPDLSDSTKSYIEQKDGNYEVYVTAEYEAFAFESNVLSYLTDQAFQEEQSIYYGSLAEMNEALKTNLLDFPMLIPTEGELLHVRISPLDNKGSALQLLGTQNLLVDGSEDIFCHYSFDLYTCEGNDSRVGISLEEDTFSFHQMEIEAIQVTAEVIAFDNNKHMIVCFTKDGVPYKLAFHLREGATADEVDTELVRQVLESLK